MERLHRAGDGRLIGPPVRFDAVILAGGRASRLGGHPKPELAYRGATLLEHALEAVDGARLAAVVGPPPDRPRPGVVFTREDPPFSGPVAALGAGLAVLGTAGPGTESPGLEDPGPTWVVVLAADLPRVRDGVEALLEALRGTQPGAVVRGADGIIGEDESGRAQPLLAVYRRRPLAAALTDLGAHGGLADRPLRHLVARLDLLPLRLPAGVSDDVDTWDAARRWGIERPGNPDVPGAAPRQEEAP